MKNLQQPLQQHSEETTWDFFFHHSCHRLFSFPPHDEGSGRMQLMSCSGFCWVLHLSVRCTVAESWKTTKTDWYGRSKLHRDPCLRGVFYWAEIINTPGLSVLLCHERSASVCVCVSVSCIQFIVQLSFLCGGEWCPLLCIKRDLKCAFISETAASFSLEGIPITLWNLRSNVWSYPAVHHLSVYPSSTLLYFRTKTQRFREAHFGFLSANYTTKLYYFFFLYMFSCSYSILISLLSPTPPFISLLTSKRPCF